MQLASTAVADAFATCGGVCAGENARSKRRECRAVHLRHPQGLSCYEEAYVDHENENDPPLFRGSSNLPEEINKPSTNPIVISIEQLIGDLFRLHDLNMDGVLDEMELIRLNEKIAQLHYGKDVDRNAIREKYSELFRTELDPNGQPVDRATFRDYMIRVLNGLDRSKKAQEMILEQFVSEAKSGRAAFRFPSFQSSIEAPFLPHAISIDSIASFPPMQRMNSLD